MTIKIKQSKTADTRTAEGPVTKEQLLESSKQHIDDVQKAMNFFYEKIEESAKYHDWTKLEHIDDFFSDFYDAQAKQFDFKRGDTRWFRMHVTTERHHLNDHVPDDVNLIDVLERIADICMAAAGRSGKDENGKVKFYSDPLSGELLQKAYENTIELLLNEIEVSDDNH